MYEYYLIAGVLDDSVERWHQGLLQMEAACIAGDVGFWQGLGRKERRENTYCIYCIHTESAKIDI